jgi:hypothetical protein
MKLKTFLTLTSFACALGIPAAVVAAVSWTPYVSEESGGPWAECAYQDLAVSGIQCSGGYCDNVRVRCETLPFDVLMMNYNTSGWFSEENSGYSTTTSEGWYRYDNSYSHVCNYSGAAGIMTGIHCSGSSCDNVELECATPMRLVNGSWQPAQLVDCIWSSYHSEEQPAYASPEGSNRFITGVSCHGSYCDNKSYYVCSLAAPAASCSGSCGGQAADGCWCDAYCASYGDCCADKVSVCG